MERQSSTSGVSSDDNDIYDVLPLDQSSDYDVPVSSSRLPAVPVNLEDDYDVPRANCSSRVWLTDNEDEDEYDIPRQHQNFDVSPQRERERVRASHFRCKYRD